MAFVTRNAMYKGSDVRVATGTLFNPGQWPRRGIDANWWSWRVVLSYAMQGGHINVFDLEAFVSALQWCFRSASNFNCRILHLCDNQVTYGIATKGRTSSGLLRRKLYRWNALLLASSCHAFTVFVKSAANPADKPSRWWGE